MKYLADTHMHSIYSYDGQMTLEQIVKRGLFLNLKYLCFTEHVEFDQINYTQFLNRFKLYKEEVEILQERYPDITLLTGIEISNPNRYLSNLEKIQELDLDYVIGSNHDLSKDTISYYLEILEIVKNGLIDSIGHLDYIKRKKESTDPMDIIYMIFEEMQKNKIVLEINSSAKRRVNMTSFPSSKIINYYLESFSNKVVIGSDAHRVSEIYDNIDKIDSNLDADKGIFIKRKFMSLSNKIDCKFL